MNMTKMNTSFFVVFSVLIITITAQRSPYAGRAPIGFPDVQTSTVSSDGLGNRFGEGDGTATTIRLPIEALGDADLVNRLMKLPIDKRPFWLLNWQALEANRNKPQTYDQRENSFININKN